MLETIRPSKVIAKALSGLHLIRNTFRYASRRDWEELARDLKPVYTAPNAEMAGVRFDEFAERKTRIVLSVLAGR